jgi:dephospho-CoA kinase
MRDILRLGLTGGIGSGKSTVSNLLKKDGAAIIDADAISRSVTQPNGAAIEPIRTVFGAEFINTEGALDRDKMRDLVYAAPSARQQLESIIHPLVGQETARQSDAAIKKGHNVIVFDIPLLVESPKWRSNLDQIIVIDCTVSVQIERVVARNGLTVNAVENIIASQANRETRLRAADMVIFNAQLSLEELAEEVAQISRRFGLSCPQPLA